MKNMKKNVGYKNKSKKNMKKGGFKYTKSKSKSNTIVLKQNVYGYKSKHTKSNRTTKRNNTKK